MAALDQLVRDQKPATASLSGILDQVVQESNGTLAWAQILNREGSIIARSDAAAAPAFTVDYVATRIREAIVEDPDRWRRATRTGAFAKRLELRGDALKRVPPWADAEHPFAEDLKRKDFFGSARLAETDVVAPGFVDEYARICRAAAPLMQFLCDALDVPY